MKILPIVLLGFLSTPATLFSDELEVLPPIEEPPRARVAVIDATVSSRSGSPADYGRQLTDGLIAGLLRTGQVEVIDPKVRAAVESVDKAPEVPMASGVDYLLMPALVVEDHVYKVTIRKVLVPSGRIDAIFEQEVRGSLGQLYDAMSRMAERILPAAQAPARPRSSALPSEAGAMAAGGLLPAVPMDPDLSADLPAVVPPPVEIPLLPDAPPPAPAEIAAVEIAPAPEPGEAVRPPVIRSIPPQAIPAPPRAPEPREVAVVQIDEAPAPTVPVEIEEVGRIVSSNVPYSFCIIDARHGRSLRPGDRVLIRVEGWLRPTLPAQVTRLERGKAIAEFEYDPALPPEVRRGARVYDWVPAAETQLSPGLPPVSATTR